MAIQDLPLLKPIIKGDSEQISFTARTPDGTGTLDLTGYRITFGAKFDLSSTTYVFLKDSNIAGHIDINAPAGTGVIHLAPSDTDDITYETVLICGLTLIDSDGEEATTRVRLPVELDI